MVSIRERYAGHDAMSRHFGASEIWLLLLALRWTVLLTLVAFAGGSMGGAMVAVLRVSPMRSLRIVTAIFIKVMQGLPLLILLFLVFFGSNILGLRVNAWTAAAIGYTLYGSVFLGEIWRGCIEAVPVGQWDAANALGLGFMQQLRLVIAPQAARIALAPSVGFLVQLLKSTSLASVIGFTELTRAGQMINNVTFQPLIVFGLVALMYFLLCWPLSIVSGRLEQRLGRRMSHGA
jgi:polar amino acid transport system permease protein